MHNTESYGKNKKRRLQVENTVRTVGIIEMLLVSSRDRVL